MTRSPKFTVTSHQDASEQETAMPFWHQRYAQIGPGRFRGSNLHLDLGDVAVGEERSNVVLSETSAPPIGTIAICIPGQADDGFINGARKSAPAFIHVGGKEIDLVTDGGSFGYYITVKESALLGFNARAFAPISAIEGYPLGGELAAWVSSILASAPESMRRTPGEVDLVLAAYIVDRVLEICGHLTEGESPTLLRGTDAHALFQSALRHADEMQDAHLSVANLAAALDVPEHILRAAFLEATGHTPRIWLRQRRLDRARRSLLNAETAQRGVTQIAMDCGFYHLGRFAAYYAKTFQETPIQTIKSRFGEQARRVAALEVSR